MSTQYKTNPIFSKLMTFFQISCEKVGRLELLRTAGLRKRIIRALRTFEGEITMGRSMPTPKLLKTLTRGPNHGYGIAQHLHRVSREALRIGEGSLYPALQRLHKH